MTYRLKPSDYIRRNEVIHDTELKVEFLRNHANQLLRSVVELNDPQYVDTVGVVLWCAELIEREQTHLNSLHEWIDEIARRCPTGYGALEFALGENGYRPGLERPEDQDNGS
jgi:hypothetical protein